MDMGMIKKQPILTAPDISTPTFGGNRRKKFEDWQKKSDKGQIYSWIDSVLQKANIKVPGKHPGNVSKLGMQIETSLHSSLRKAVNNYLDTIKEDTPQHEILNGITDIIHGWTNSVEKDADRFITEVFERGFVAGALDAGVEPVFGKIDKMAIEWITKNPKRIGSAIKTFSQDVINEFEKIITNSYGPEGEFSLYGLIKEMSAVTKAQRYKLERIARTETAAISNGGRLYAWNQDSNRYLYKYLWNAMPDNRAKPISLKRHLENPYTADEIDFLWNHQEELINGKWFNDVFNQRCSISRTPIEKEFQGFRFGGYERNYRRTS